MIEALPPIKIKVECAPREFLERMALLAGGGNFIVEEHYDARGETGFHVLNLRFTGNSKHDGLGGQLIVRPEHGQHVSVEVRAARWHPDSPPTYQAYVEAARSLFRPLISHYNRKYQTKRRLHIATQKQLEPKLSPNCEKLFKRFTTLANTSSLHPLDWKRFYEFVVGCRNRDKYTEEDIAWLLRKEGFSVEYAENIGSVYAHLCRFKRFF